MKKLMLYLAGMLASFMLITDASAIPAFARQVGMPCSACHFQHFPALTAFGRSFKQGGYTMIGAQQKIEDDSVSIPVVLNAAMIGYMSYAKTNGTNSPSTTVGLKNTNDGQLQIPQQVSLFLGGRAGEHVGFEAEVNLNGSTTASGGTGTGNAGMIRLKVPFVYDAGSAKVEMIPFSTANGAADSFEVLNTGAVNVHSFNQNDQKAFSAQQYMGTGTNAHGVAFAASNSNFFANFAKWGASSGSGGSGAPTSNYLRAAWTTDAIRGFDSAIGFQGWSGTSGENTPTVNPLSGIVDTKAGSIDAQMMGDVAGMPLLLIASYARAPSTSAADFAAGTNINLFNPNIFDRKSFNMGAELGVLPRTTVQLGFRRASSGLDAGTFAGGAANGQNASDNAWVFGATYSMALNARVELTYSKYSGDLYNAATKAAGVNDNQLYLDLAFGF